ncbi:MAG: hypothetical protein HY343_11800 [Lentisphaerae bacterium]|nr:hypothetical protein [Lentisphaerota bacterium]
MKSPLIRKPFVLLLLVVLLISCRTTTEELWQREQIKRVLVCRDVDRFLAYYERTYRFLSERNEATDPGSREWRMADPRGNTHPPMMTAIGWLPRSTPACPSVGQG